MGGGGEEKKKEGFSLAEAMFCIRSMKDARGGSGGGGAARGAGNIESKQGGESG